MTNEEFLATTVGDRLVSHLGHEFKIVEAGDDWRRVETGAILPFPDNPTWHLRYIVGVVPANNPNPADGSL